MGPVRDWIDQVARAVELGGVLLIGLGLVWATVRFLFADRSLHGEARYQRYRKDLARSILLGLEVLVGADIIGTVSASPTLQSVLVLGLIVMIRTFLSFSIEWEVERRPPWARSRAAETPG